MNASSRRLGFAFFLTLSLTPVAVLASGQDGPSAPDFNAAWGPPRPLDKLIDQPLGVIEETWWRKPLLLVWFRLNGVPLPLGGPDYFVEKKPGQNSQGNPLATEMVQGDAIAEWDAIVKITAPDLHPGKAFGDSAAAPWSKDRWEMFVNCPAGAWGQARTTLIARQKTWGADSAALRDWIKGQHQVFARCPLGPSYFRRDALGPNQQPNPLYVQSVLLPDMNLADPPPDAPPLLAKDRAYQRASALFYEGHYAEAALAFDAVAKDAASPWRSLGHYLALRAKLRSIQIWPEVSDPYGPSCDSENCEKAQDGIETYRQREGRRLRAEVVKALDLARPTGNVEEIGRLEDLQSLVSARLDPSTSFRELAKLLYRPELNAAAFRRASTDYLLLHRQYPPSEPMGEWMAGLVSGTDPRGTACKALGAEKKRDSLQTTNEIRNYTRCLRAQWSEESLMRFQKQPAQYAWLFSAAVFSERGDAHLPRLLTALAAVSTENPGAATFMLQRVRLGQKDDALPLAEVLLKRPEVAIDNSARNRVHEYRMQFAQSLKEFWDDAVRVEGATLDRDTLMAGAAPDTKTSELANWDYDANWILNYELPNSALIETALHAEWPENLRRQIADLAWGKAQWRGDAGQARQAIRLMLKNFPAHNAGSGEKSQLENLLAIDNDADFLIVSRVLPSGPRARISGDTCRLKVPKADDYTPEYQERVGNLNYQFGKFAKNILSDADFKTWQKERAELDALPDLDVLRMRARLEFAKRFPLDNRVPELLREAIYIPRNNWCAAAEAGKLSEQAFILLKRKYPKSDAAQSTKYWFKSQG